mmetsp:Transcript_70648/g.132208  ORF Transcript_70648/g.132208 Transcript_70648/m.132208 type:complete len:251 (-) Transcript_70648:221-973(-)
MASCSIAWSSERNGASNSSRPLPSPPPRNQASFKERSALERAFCDLSMNAPYFFVLPMTFARNESRSLTLGTGKFLSAASCWRPLAARAASSAMLRLAAMFSGCRRSKLTGMSGCAFGAGRPSEKPAVALHIRLAAAFSRSSSCRCSERSRDCKRFASPFSGSTSCNLASQDVALLKSLRASNASEPLYKALMFDGSSLMTTSHARSARWGSPSFKWPCAKLRYNELSSSRDSSLNATWRDAPGLISATY